MEMAMNGGNMAEIAPYQTEYSIGTGNNEKLKSEYRLWWVVK
jgi:hypothetical protein